MRTLHVLAAALALVAAALLAPTAARAQSVETATVQWSAPTKNTDGSAITGALTYNVYYGTTAAGPFALLGTSAGTSYTHQGVAPGTACYTVAAVESETPAPVTGAQTAPVCVTIPVPTETPGVPGSVTVNVSVTVTTASAPAATKATATATK